MAARPLAESLVNGFLLAAEHSHSATIAAAAAAAEPTQPATVRKAIEFMEADPQASLSVSDLAAQCGVSVRALQLGFQRHVGTSPMSYLRDVRLRRADAELCAVASPDETVASIAPRWGFTHPERFAAVYEARYGRLPGQILRAAR
jgi:transcriptional regulator GlxA family with amidase domain